MKWRRRMLRRKTDPKTGKHTVCEPSQSKCTQTFHKSHCVEIYRENGRGHLRGQHFVRACAVEMHMDMSQEAFSAEISGKMPNARDTTSDEQRALTPTVRTPQCGHTVWGTVRTLQCGHTVSGKTQPLLVSSVSWCMFSNFVPFPSKW